jgi:hypothetical protein
LSDKIRLARNEWQFQGECNFPSVPGFQTISHSLGIETATDQLVLVGGDRDGTLIEGSYDRGRPGIPGLNPTDTRAVQNLLVPRRRSYVP